MKKTIIRIAVPSNNGKDIYKGMLGRADKFFIFEIDEGKKFSLIEERKNPYSRSMQHLKTLDVYNLIKDCSVILSAKIGKKGIDRLRQRNVRLIFRKGKIDEQLISILKTELF